MQLPLAQVTRWTDSHRFRFSPTKTVTVHFSWVRGSFRDPDLYLYYRRLPVVELTRFLDMILDRRLTWLPHLRDLKVVCTKGLSLLRVLSHLSWGADRTVLLRLYPFLIMTKLDYGCQLYSPFGFSIPSIMQESGWQRAPSGRSPFPASLLTRESCLLTFTDRP